MTEPRRLTIGNVEVANDAQIAIIAGPCAMESRQHALDMSGALAEMATKLGFSLIKLCLIFSIRTSLKIFLILDFLMMC